MLELVTADGRLITPLLVCSVISACIIAESFWSMHIKHILPLRVI